MELLYFSLAILYFFNKEVFGDIEKFKNEIGGEIFKQEVIKKLEDFKNVKIQKLQALAFILEVLKNKGVQQYSALTNLYFNMSIKDFEKYLPEQYYKNKKRFKINM